MEELIRPGDVLFEEYESLILERDQLMKECDQIWIAYMKTFGELTAAGYEEMVACIRCRKIISYYQKALNHGGAVDPDAMRVYLDKEMAGYELNLKRMTEDYERCRSAGVSTPYEAGRAKVLYRRMAKLLHPDINPKTDEEEVLRDLWMRLQAAYHANDVRELSALEVLVRKALKDLGIAEISVEIPDIGERIDELKEEISTILHTEPYLYRDLLEDEGETEKKRAELQEELDSYRRYHEELDGIIAEMENSGGIRKQWLVN